MRANVKITGLKKVSRKLEAMARAAGDENAHGVRMLGEHVATDVRASRPGAGIPKDEGTLMRSIQVTGPDERDTVRLTAGGAAAPYAIVQHEVMEYHHDLGEARYWIRGLERAVSGGQPEKALQEVADELVRIGKVTP